MKKRNPYQMPRNWRKVKRVLEQRIAKNKRLKNETHTIFDKVYLEEWTLIKKLEEFKNTLSHRYEHAYVNKHHRLILGKDTGYAIDKCPFCYLGEGSYSLNVTLRRLNTMYHNEESNYTTCCVFCYREQYDHYEELWNDYYASAL